MTREPGRFSAPSTAVPFEIEGADGGPLRLDAYEIEPGTSDRVIVLCHGFRSYKDWGFLPLLAGRLALDGTPAVTFSFSGSGITDADGTFGEKDRFRTHTYGQQLGDLDRVLAWAASRYGRANGTVHFGLAGHSRGGAIAALQAARDERVRALVLLATPERIGVWPETYFEAWKRGEDVATHDFRTRETLALGPDLIREFWADPARYDVPAALERLRIPILLVQGDRDQSVGVEEARSLAGRAPAVSTELHVLSGAGHHFESGTKLRRTPGPLLDMIELVAAWMRRWLIGSRSLER